VDEQGHSYKRGQPEPIDSRTARLLATAPFHDVFLLSESPVALTASDPQWSSIKPEEASCAWRGDYACLTGPFLEAQDDDDHTYRRGCPFEICSKTLAVLDSSSYRRHFAFINRASGQLPANDISGSSTGSCC
jgi:hypothetical protein